MVGPKLLVGVPQVVWSPGDSGEVLPEAEIWSPYILSQGIGFHNTVCWCIASALKLSYVQLTVL